MKHSFGSDNHSGIHPEILKAITEANEGYESAYGDDRYTEEAARRISELFGGNCEVYFVMNGTGANCTSLSHISPRFGAVICTDHAHINVDECNAPENICGCRLIPIKSQNGKITAADIKPKLTSLNNQHQAQPAVVSLTQPTEFGTLYSDNEIKEIADLIHSNGGLLHIDGARIANAAAAKGKSVKEITRNLGADILSFGGTKNGMMMGEAVVIFNDRIKNDDTFKYIRKQSAQLISKMRYIGAQFNAYLKDGLFMKSAANANAMAKYMESRIADITYIELTEKVDTNAVFVRMPREKADKLLEKHHFYIWDENENIVRWMCSFSTTKEDVDSFVEDLKTLI